MTRQYTRENNSSPQKDTDNWILQRSAVRELSAKPLTPQRKTPAGDRDGINLDLMHIPVSDRSAMPVQAKLEIGSANDKYEKEADRVAKQVVQKLHEPHSAQLQKPQTFQGEVNQEVEEALQRKSRLQLKGNQGEMTAAPELESSISRSRGSGQPLSEGIREPMEKEFGGVDFSGVKVHTDGNSDRLNQSMQAKAFTTGQDVFFRQGEYNPGSQGGKELIAHELTHVVQQNGGVVQGVLQHKKDEEEKSKKQRRVAQATKTIALLGNNIKDNLDRHIFQAIPSDGGQPNIENPVGLHAYHNQGQLPQRIGVDSTNGSANKVHTLQWHWQGSEQRKSSTMFPQWMPPTHVRTLIALKFPVTRKEQVEDNIFREATEKYIQRGLKINLKKSGDTVYPNLS